jgi:DNA-binding NarL/FixJ family response regulator
MKIMVIDNHILFREGIISLLNTQPDMVIVGESDVSDHAVQIAMEGHPDIILLDVSIFQLEGIEIMKSILSCQPEISFIIMTTQDSDDLFYEIISSGAKGYLLKSTTKPMLLASLRALGRGEAVIPRGRVSKVLNELVRLGRLTPIGDHEKDINLLTYRELEVLKMLVTRATNREIASQLSISENTVRVHVSNILEKLKLRNRREASAFASRISLMEPGHLTESHDAWNTRSKPI